MTTTQSPRQDLRQAMIGEPNPCAGVPELGAADTADLATAVLDLLTAINDGSLDRAHDAAERASIAGYQLTIALEDLAHLDDEDTAHDFHDYRRRTAELVDATVTRFATTAVGAAEAADNLPPECGDH